MCVDVNVHFNCSHWIAGPSYQPESNEKRTHCRKSFIKNVAQMIDSETPCVIIIINIIIEVQGPASVL